MQKNLTPREQEIFNLLLKDFTAKEIAYKLNLSYPTFDAGRTKLYKKQGVKNKKELTSKYSASILYNSVINKGQNLSNSLASEDKPLTLHFIKTPPWGYYSGINFPMFNDSIITRGDVYVFYSTFLSNVDFKMFQLSMADDSGGEMKSFFLYPPHPVIINVKANTVYSSSTILTHDKTASSANALSNRFNVHVAPVLFRQPVLTFTQFYLKKIKPETSKNR